MEFNTIVRQMSSDFPGFPPFVHHILAKYELGHTRDEIVEELKKEGIQEAIEKLVQNVESTHATYVGTNIVLPTPAFSKVEEDNRCLANMILSATDKKREDLDTEHGVSRGDESVSEHDDGR